MAHNNPKLTRDAEAATPEVCAFEARRADRQDDYAVFGTEVTALDAQMAAASARDEPVTALQAERESRLQRQRDLAAILPLLEQQLAEARAKLHRAQLWLGSALRTFGTSSHR